MPAARYVALSLLCLSLCSATINPVAVSGIPGYHLRSGFDVSECKPPCMKLKDCDNFQPGQQCNVGELAQLCDALEGCAGFNDAGWAKGCTNECVVAGFTGRAAMQSCASRTCRAFRCSPRRETPRPLRLHPPTDL